ncbi:MAG: cysteine desulfurase [Flavobacteriales bacterium]|nr:cysteine desulfurase [Flavobacteriales bacterium]
MDNDTLQHKMRELKTQFPALNQTVYGRPLVYLDNAATTQKPQRVIDSISEYYSKWNANIHRGAHYLANASTEKFEATRSALAEMLHANFREEIIFTQGSTDSVNMLSTILENEVEEGDEIWVTEMEHHANFVPWQMLALKKKAHFRYIPMLPSGEWDLAYAKNEITDRAKIVAFNWVSNALGTVNPVDELISLAKTAGAYVVIDGAQAVAHFDINVQALNCDFFLFSAHKMYGPTGLGVLWGRKELLEKLPPYRFGGEMIRKVSVTGTTFNDLPFKYEAGTPNIEAVIAFNESISFCNEIGRENMHQHEYHLLQLATEELRKIEGSTIYADLENKVGVLSFNVEGIHSADIGTLLDQQGVAVRTGHHCTQPLWEKLGTTGSVRASFACYNTVEDVELFIAALNKSVNMLR